MSEVYNAQLVRPQDSFIRFHLADLGLEDAFELYHKIQEQDQTRPSSNGIGLPALGHALAGSAGTAISHVVLYPLGLIITRLQVQKQLRRPGEAPSAATDAEDAEYKSLQDAVKKIYDNEGGLSAFWNGWKEDTTKSIVDSFLFFLAYTALRQRQQAKLGTKSLPVLTELGVGILAGAFSKLITTPIQQIVTRKQTAAMLSARDPTVTVPMSATRGLSIKDIALQIRSEKGLAGFWSGYSASLILTLNPAFTFLLQNLLRRIVARSQRKSDLGPKTMFLVAAISKAIASTLTYPFNLAKSRAQVSKAPAPEPPAFKDDTRDSKAGSKIAKLDPPAAASSSTKKDDVLRTAKTEPKALPRLLATHMANLAVIRSLRTIYATEGLPGLYSGLEADVIRGFLGHGLSMALKERIHVAVIAGYYFALKIMRRWPEEMGSVREQAGREFERVRSGAGAVVEGVKGAGEAVVDGVRGAAGDMVEGVRGVVKSD